MKKQCLLCGAILSAILSSLVCSAFTPHSNAARSRYEFVLYRRKQPVEQVDVITGEVLEVFSSMKEAERMVGVYQQNISAVLAGRAKSSGGYYWRRPGDTTPPPKRNKYTKAVEQVDVETGQVLAVFPSMVAAAQALGIREQGISRVVGGCKDRCSYKGFFWREAGDTTMPKVRSDKNAKSISHLRQKVEQVCPETGAVIATFNSSQEAAKELGIPQTKISTVLRGIQKTARGYHFRKIGKPEKFKKSTTARPVQQICLKSGKLLETFPSQNSAADAVGVTSASIRNAAIGHTKSSGGYGWRHVAFQDEVRNVESNVVGKKRG